MYINQDHNDFSPSVLIIIIIVNTMSNNKLPSFKIHCFVHISSTVIIIIIIINKIIITSAVILPHSWSDSSAYLFIKVIEFKECGTTFNLSLNHSWRADLSTTTNTPFN